MATPFHPLRSNRSSLRLVAVLLAAIPAAAGCQGSGGPPSPGSTGPALGPHGAPTLPLGGLGFAEVVVEPVAPNRPQVELAVYLLGPDGSSPLSATPTEVRASVTHPESPGPIPVTLSSRPDPSSPAGAGRYASEPGRFDYDELAGEVTVVIDGQTYVNSFSRR
ncbi:hypothetical protein [Tautonia sociabilis]|uniref:Lipoprotein n=1 Tax=Tautonia sociabilis TaxID=2080755 RepID=A0A432MD71_9BACT|nr:hypothetical protein [Tautonia sociabilis]RUL81742.1 hypothetical protein TsocGM_24585 [Tautonia sociabilis]